MSQRYETKRAYIKWVPYQIQFQDWVYNFEKFIKHIWIMSISGKKNESQLYFSWLVESHEDYQKEIAEMNFLTFFYW